MFHQRLTRTAQAAIIVSGGGGGGTAPSFTTQPSSQTTSAGSTATFTAVSTGTAPITSQWQRNPGGNTAWADIAGATSASYTTPNAALTGGSANNGDTYRRVDTNSVGSTASSAAILTVTSGVDTRPRFGYGPANATSDATLLANLFTSMTAMAATGAVGVGTGSSNGGRAGSFNTAASSTNYTWFAVLASALSGGGPRVFDGTGYGGFAGAASSGIYSGADQDPITTHLTYTDGNGNVWWMYRGNGKAATFSTFTLS